MAGVNKNEGSGVRAGLFPGRVFSGLARPTAVTGAFVLGYLLLGAVLTVLLDGGSPVAVSVLADAGLAFAAFLYWRRRYYRPYREAREVLGLDEAFRWVETPSGFMNTARFVLWTFLLWYVFQFGAAWLLSRFGDAAVDARHAAAGASPGAYVFLAVVAAPVAEELFMRGVVMNLFMEHRSAAAGVVASSLLFGVMHGSATYLYFGTAMGFLLAAVYLETRRLWCCVLAHCALNALSLVMPVPSSGGAWFTVTALALNALALQSLWQSLSWDCLLADSGRCIYRARK